MASLQTVATALTGLRQLIGVPVIWKTITMWHVQHECFQEALYHHCNPFCVTIKALHGKHCSYQESTGLLTMAEQAQGPFVKMCHAGVVELVAPVIASGSIQGFLCAGPFRRADAICPYDNADVEYAAAPVLDEQRHNTLLAILAVNADGLGKLHPLYEVEDAIDTRINQAIAYLRQHFHEPIRVADLATRCAMSESRFTHLFTTQTGVSFSNFLIMLRVEEAKRLLADPRRIKAQIAIATGFSDQSHFSATFKKRTGMTPGQFQRRLLQESETMLSRPAYPRDQAPRY